MGARGVWSYQPAVWSQRRPAVTETTVARPSMVVQSYDTIPRSVYRDGHSVFGGQFAVPPVCLALALADSDWDTRNRALDTILRKKIAKTTNRRLPSRPRGRRGSRLCLCSKSWAGRLEPAET